MPTGNVTNWDGNIVDIGPIYPFVGWEGFMVVLCLVFWIAWHIIQVRGENAQLNEEAQKLRQADTLKKALDSEHSPERM
jgi:hypothetical protein